MEYWGRIYILKNSYPDFVDIKSEKYAVDEHIEIKDQKTFNDNIGHWLALSKSPDYEVNAYIDPCKCRMLYFRNGSMWSTCGRINLKKVGDIEYYLCDEETQEETFRDIMADFLLYPNENIMRATYDSSIWDRDNWKESCKNNMDVATAGRNLAKMILSETLIDYTNYSQVPLSYLLQYYLSDEAIVQNVAPKYPLKQLLKVGKNFNKNPTTTMADCVYSVIWGIYTTTNNLDDIRQIVRHMIKLTEEQYVDRFSDGYQKIADYLNTKSAEIGDDVETLTMQEIEENTGVKLDYKYLYRTSLLTYKGWDIIKVDFENGIVYFDRNYL